MILCIDDDPDILGYLSVLLRNEGHDVIEATNGRDALAMLHAYTPDIIICDIEMPGMNGFEFLNAMRQEHHELDDIPLIFMTAKDDKEDIIIGLELGADDYLNKPVDNRYLIAKVNAFLRQVSRMQEKKKQEHVKIYTTMSKKQTIDEADTVESCDKLLERLEHEYNERLRLKDILAELKDKLQGSQSQYMSSLKKINELERSLSTALESLGSIRIQLVNVKKTLCERGMSITEVQEQIDSITQSVDDDRHLIQYTAGRYG